MKSLSDRKDQIADCFPNFHYRIICGLTGFTNKNHLIRAALEAICFQTRDILEAMHQDCGFVLNKLNVDGKLSGNNLLMQLQSDLCGIPVCELLDFDVAG